MLSECARTGRGVYDQFTDDVGFRWRGGSGSASQVGTDAGEQLQVAERFGEVIVGAGIETDDGVDFGVAGGEDHDNAAGLGGAQLTAHFDSVEVRKAEVEKPKIEIPLGRFAQRGSSAAAPRDLVAVGVQAVGEHLADGLVVLDEQQLRHSGNPFGGGASTPLSRAEAGQPGERP